MRGRHHQTRYFEGHITDHQDHHRSFHKRLGSTVSYLFCQESTNAGLGICRTSLETTPLIKFQLFCAQLSLGIVTKWNLRHSYFHSIIHVIAYHASLHELRTYHAGIVFPFDLATPLGQLLLQILQALIYTKGAAIKVAFSEQRPIGIEARKTEKGGESRAVNRH